MYIQYKKALLNCKNRIKIGQPENLMWKYRSNYIRKICIYMVTDFYANNGNITHDWHYYSNLQLIYYQNL